MAKEPDVAPRADDAAPADNSADPKSKPSFCVVGLGASAGGLEAFRQFLAALPADTGLGFVIVQHLAPKHVSSLAEILSRSTTMPVIEVQDEPRVEANHVYVIPPGKTMVIADRTLTLQPREKTGLHHPIDLFFKSLARDQGHTPIGVILSGTGNDGTMGLREIKDAGGITFAQDESAQHDGMTRSAIAAKCVDFVLPPQRIAAEIARIAHHPYIVPAEIEAAPTAEEEQGLQRILGQLRRTTDVDFANYKPNTIQRRVARRMVLHRLETLDEYAHLLDDRPEEAAALFQDILIGVTGFFRDTEIFESLQREVFPNLLMNRARSDPLRIWVPGCSTGEEAYSYAMAAAEFISDANLAVPVQIFATDVNAASVDKARAGIYPKSIVQDLSETRLRRFFVEVDGSYRISKAIRDTCVFARHNVLRDPPFSRIDLISCRNLLIYLNADLQKKLLNQLHYALKQGAYLVLGNSETISAHRQLFEAHDSRHKIYRKTGGPGRLTKDDARSVYPHHIAQPGRNMKVDNVIPDVGKDADRIVLAKYAPAGVVVDAEMEIQQFRGDTAPYLMPASGKASLNLFKMAREGLLIPLRAAIHKAKKQHFSMREEGLRLRIENTYRDINLEVIPMTAQGGKNGGFLVLFEPAADRPRTKGDASQTKARKATRRAASRESAEEEATRLAQELTASREYLQSVIEQQEVANEELQSANEEAQSANEELQSINEELETSKEEIQSTNEELATVNDELQNRNLEVGQINNDLVNLLASLDTAIVMVGHDLRIRRYTPLAEKVFNLIPGDVGRPLTDIKLKLALPDLDQLVATVIDSITPQEFEVQDIQGRWYLLRVRPYKTLEAKIDGAVLVLVDIDSIKRAREFAENIVATVREPLLVLDHELRIRSASASFSKTFRLPATALNDQFLHAISGGEWNNPILLDALTRVLSEEKSFEDLELNQNFATIGVQALLVNARRLFQESAGESLILMSMEIITERKRLAESVRKIEQLSEADRNKNEFLAMLAHELRNPLAPLQNALHVLRTATLDEATRERAREMMERQIRIMTRLVDDLLDSARVTQGKIGLFREAVDINALLNHAAQAVQPLLERKKQTLSVALLPAPAYVNADATRLEQSFGNLLNNASKFSGLNGQISLTAELGYSRPVSAEADEVIVRIRDDGAGISASMLPHVFDLFMQSDRSLDRTQGGLGIGLTLTRRLLELHGGTIEAHSDGLGLGSEFTVRLPVLAPDRVTTRTKRAVASAEQQVKRRILVVDDNIDAAESLAMILRSAGHDVLTEHTAAGALQTAVKMRPGIVVLDIGLPEMDGYQVARQLRAHEDLKDAMLIALSGYGQDDDRKRGVEAGFDHHFTKPVDYQALCEVFDRASGGEK